MPSLFLPLMPFILSNVAPDRYIRERAFVPFRCLAIGTVSDARLTNWYFPEIIAYYIENNFHSRQINREYETIVLFGAKMREGMREKGAARSRQGVASCANDNYFAAFRQPGDINLSMRTRHDFCVTLSMIIDFFRVHSLLYNRHLAFYVAC